MGIRTRDDLVYGRRQRRRCLCMLPRTGSAGPSMLWTKREHDSEKLQEPSFLIQLLASASREPRPELQSTARE